MAVPPVLSVCRDSLMYRNILSRLLFFQKPTRVRSTTDLINKCEIFLCFANRENANVMFELGYALGNNKKVILIGDPREIPPDLRNMLYIKRGAGSYEILEQLEKHLSSKIFPPSVPPTYWHQPEDAIAQLLERPELSNSMESRDFEKLIADWFESKDYLVDHSLVSKDLGYDFTVYPFLGEKALVEVKKYKATSQISVSTIRQMVGSIAIKQARIGVIISSAPFTQAARYFASEIDQKIFLWTLEDLNNFSKMKSTAINDYLSKQ